MPDSQLFLMLIKVSETLKNHESLKTWIDEIEVNYMAEFGSYGSSVSHLVLTGPWDFALVFPGSTESVASLTAAVEARGGGGVEILTMPATDLDQFRSM